MKRLNVNISDKEMEILQQFCEEQERTQADVIREFIRSLEDKLRQGGSK